MGGRRSRRLQGVTLPTLSERQSQILAFALKYVGYPYVWAGEYPTKDSPYGYQEHGGFDCSGFVWWVLKIHFKYPISVNERGASDMARSAKPRISRSALMAGDLIFFGTQRARLHGSTSTTPASTWGAAGSSTRRARATA